MAATIDAPRAASGSSARCAALVLGALLGLSGCRKDHADEARALLRQAEEALAHQQWEVAQGHTARVATLSGLPEALRDQTRLREEQARAEIAARAQYARFAGSLETDPDTAVTVYKELPQTSYYRAQAREAYERLRPSYISAHLEKAKAALQNHRCDDHKAQLQLVLEVDPTNAAAIEQGKAPCQPAE